VYIRLFDISKEEKEEKEEEKKVAWELYYNKSRRAIRS